MRVRMLVEIQGFGVRSDGSRFEWPAKGGEIELEPSTALEMIQQGHAIPISTFLGQEVAGGVVVGEEVRARDQVATAATVTARPPGKRAAAVDPPAVAAIDEVSPPGDETVTDEPVAEVRRGPGRPRTRPE